MSKSLTKIRRDALFIGWPTARQIEAILEQLAEMSRPGKGQRVAKFEELLAEIEAIRRRHPGQGAP